MNALHKIVPDDIFFAECYGGDAFDLSDNFQRFHKSRPAAGRQINLRDITGDHSFAVESQASQKHFHLFGGGVLRFVENHERIIQRAATHKREGRNFDNSLLQKTFEFIGVEHS